LKLQHPAQFLLHFLFHIHTMGLSRSRTITLGVAVATLTSNTLSSILFHQLPDDPYHLANNFSWYLHFANVLSVFGFIGALRQHALSISLFSNYLIIDTILCAIPRFLIVSLLQDLSASLCTPAPSPLPYTSANSQFLSSTTPPSIDSTPNIFSSWRPRDSWSEVGCYRIVSLVQLTMAAGIIAVTLLQFVGALAVREYARALWLREIREECRVVAAVERVSFCEERGLPVIFEEEEIGEKL
jgi:hypothetical protein